MPPLSSVLTGVQRRALLPTRPPPFRHLTAAAAENPGALDARTYVGAQTVPQGYGNGPFGPASGVVVGIVLGSVAGFLLFLALVYWCINLGQGPRMREEGSVGAATSSVVSWHSRPRGPPRRHHRRTRHSPRREKIEIRRERVVPVQVTREREDQIVVEEFQERSRSRPRSASRGPPLPPDSVLSDGGDMIVVEEDHPPPRRRRDSMRSQRTRRSDDRRGSYREDIYIRDVSRQRSSSRA